MTNIHFLEMIHQFDDIIQTHVLLQLQEETDVASRLVLISYLEMEMPGNRSQDILKLSVFINQWELGKTCRICLFFYVGFLRSRNLLDRILSGWHEFGIVLIRWLMGTGYQMNSSKGDAGDDKDGCNGSHLSHRAPERKQLGGLLDF